MNQIRKFYQDNPPVFSDGARRHGSITRSEYWKGFDGQPTIAHTTSHAYQAWLAGRHAGRVDRDAKNGAVSDGTEMAPGGGHYNDVMFGDNPDW